MQTTDKENSDKQRPDEASKTTPVGNPFENNQSVEKDIAGSKQELENEQKFKEASTERD